MGEKSNYMMFPELLQHSKTMQAHATKRIADFTALDGTLNAGWLAAWQAAIDEAEATDTDETYLDQLQGLTQQVHIKAEQLLTTLHDLRYYASKAFGKRTERYKAFGFARMAQLPSKTTSFVLFAMVDHALAVQLQAPLLAAGMSAPQIAAINTAVANLALADVAQELHKRNRLIVTGTRTERIQTMYKFMQEANSAAQVIYAKLDDHRALFELKA